MCTYTHECILSRMHIFKCSLHVHMSFVCESVTCGSLLFFPHWSAKWGSRNSFIKGFTILDGSRGNFPCVLISFWQWFSMSLNLLIFCFFFCLLDYKNIWISKDSSWELDFTRSKNQRFNKEPINLLCL